MAWMVHRVSQQNGTAWWVASTAVKIVYTDSHFQTSIEL
jgi:hypothetical protein